MKRNNESATVLTSEQQDQALASAYEDASKGDIDAQEFVTNHLNETTTLTTSDGESFESIFRCESKADKRAEFALYNTVELYAIKLGKVESVLAEDPTYLEMKTSANKQLSRYLVKYYLSLDTSVRKEIKTDLVKLLIKEVAMYELPLNSLIEQVQLRIAHLFTGDLQLKKAYSKGEVENVFASMIVRMGETLGLFRVTKKESTISFEGDFKHEYDLVHPTLELSDKEVTYLHKRLLKEPKNHPIDIKLAGDKDESNWFSGDSIKFNRAQPQFVWDRLNKISSYAYQINDRLYNKFPELFRQTFPTQKEAKKFDEVVKANIGKPLYFDAKYTADNGRINIIGYYLGAQVGGRNHLIEVHEDAKEYLTDSDRYFIRGEIDSLGVTKDLKLKDKLMKLAYMQALEDDENGLKVGLLIDYDGKLSGQQGMAVLCKSKPEAYYSGMLAEFEDGYLSLAAAVNLDRNATKGGMNPYQYGAGEKTTVAGIMEEGGHAIDWNAWEEGFKSTFPSAYALMKYVKNLTRDADLGHRVDYTTPAGFNAVVTSYETFTTTYNNMYGRDRKHHIKVIKSNDYGAQLVAVLGHFMDASELAFVIDDCDFHILPVHDNYRCLVGNRHKVLESHVKGNRYMLGEPILEAYINEAFSDYLGYFGIKADVSKLLRNDLEASDIVGGLY